jgi:bacteriorhodopsin
MILSVFALVLLLTGSVVVDMYNKTDARADWQFHYFTGITSIITGVACIAYAMYTGLQTKTGKQIRAVLVKGNQTSLPPDLPNSTKETVLSLT